jgi:MFS family permease
VKTNVSRRPFVLLQLANISGASANAMAFIAIPWLVLELSGSALSAGVVAAVAALPAIAMSPVAGLLIDRVGRRQISILSDVLSGVSVLLIPLVALLGQLDVWVVALAALLGAAFDPAGYTARKTLIEPAAKASGVNLNRANSVHEALFAMGYGVGPALGALLIGLIGTTASFGVIAILFGIASVAVLFVPPKSTTIDDDQAEPPGAWWRDAIAGFRVIRADKALLVVTAFIVFVDFVYMPTEVVILPTYFQTIDNPWGMGIVISAMSIGGVVGAYSYAALAKRFSLRTIILGSSLTSSGLLFGLAFFPPVWVMALFGCAVGISWGPMGPLLNTLVQTRCKPSVQGRVFGAQMALFASGPPLGMVVVGALVEGFGVYVVYPIVVTAVFVFALVLLALRQLESVNRPALDDSVVQKVTQS